MESTAEDLEPKKKNKNINKQNLLIDQVHDSVMAGNWQK